MSSTSNYNAITNLVETVIDYLIVDTAEIDTATIQNLDCNVGVIDTLSSTTATLTSANIPTLTNTTLTNTTSNTTNLNTNNIQPNPVSSAVSLYTTGTGLLTLGNTSNTNALTINQSTLLQSNKNLTLAGTGKIITPKLRVSDLSADKIVLTDANDDLVSSSWGQSDLVILSANNTFTGNNIFSTFNTFNGNVLANTLRGTTAGSTISLYETSTAGITLGNTSNTNNIKINQNIELETARILLCSNFRGLNNTDTITLFGTTTTGPVNIGGAMTSSNMRIGNITNANDTGTLTINKIIVVGENKNLTLSGTAKITTPAILVSGLTGLKIVLTDSSGNLISSSWTDTEFPRLSANNTFSGNNIFSGTSTFNNTILGNTLTGTTTGSAISLFGTSTSTLTLGNTSNTNALTINQNTTLPANKIITLNATGGKVLCNVYEGASATDSINLFITTTGVGNPTITLGNLSGGTFTINPNTTMNGNLTLASSKTITLNATGGKVLCNVYTGTTTSSNLTIGETGDTGTLTIFKTIAGTLSVNNIQGSTTSSAITLFTLSSVSSPTITLGNLSGGTFTINPNTTMNGNLTLASSKTITLNATGGKVLSNVYTGTTTSSNLTIGETGDTGTLTIFKTIAGTFAVDTISATTTTSTGSLFNNIGAGVVGIATSLTGSMNLATSMLNGILNIGGFSFVAGTNTGSIAMYLPLTCNQNITLVSGKTLSVNDIQGTTTSSSITLFTNSSLSSPTITLGNVSGGLFTINPNTTMNGTLTLASGKNLTLNSTGNLICNTLQGTTTSSTISIYANITAGIINIGAGLSSSSALNIATLLLNGIITIGNSSFNPATNIGYVVCHMPLYLNQDFNLATGKNVITSSTSKVYCNVYTGIGTSSNLTIGESGDTGNLLIYKTITTGNTYSGTNTFSGGNTHSGSNTFSGAINTFNNTLACNTFRGVAAADNISLFSTTTGSLTLGATTGSGLTINPSITLPANKTITLNPTGGSILCPTYNSTSATQALTIGSTNTTANVSIATGLTTGILVLGSNGTFSSNYSAADLYMQTTGGTDKILYGNTIRATTYLTVVQPASLYSTNTTQNITIGAGITSGLISIGNRDNATTGYTLFQHRLRQTLKPGGFDNSSYWNVAIGSANNIFQSSILSASAMPPIYTGAQTNRWSVWESDTQSEGSFIAQNGDTMIICNPCDAFAINFQDEDSMGVADGFKMDLDGVITTVSDRRLKRDINPIPVGSDLLDKLSLLEYINYKKKAPTEEKYYRNGKLRNKYQKIRKGLIAQDVKKIFPEVVEKEGEYHMMKYAEVDIYFNMGVQELIKRDKEKQVIIDDLTARLVRLEQLILNP